MVTAGSVCIDKYEVSVWSSPTGGTQYGTTSDNYPCGDDGQNCTNIYARSVPGVLPSRFITWFQAQQALANVGKRLPTNADWQLAATGSPNPGPDNATSDCNTAATATTSNTGSRSSCVSRFGAFDMVGNVSEWVADWVPQSTGCGPTWDPAGDFTSNDVMCFAGAAANDGPGTLVRGGFFGDGMGAGPFAVLGNVRPQASGGFGFRGAR
jgi:formylglycine-generating enzyme required for sulfatase activity